MSDVDTKIEALSAQRQLIWRIGVGFEDLPAIAAQLADLYETKRHDDAATRSGVSRADILRRARIESELERLINR